MSISCYPVGCVISRILSECPHLPNGWAAVVGGGGIVWRRPNFFAFRIGCLIWAIPSKFDRLPNGRYNAHRLFSGRGCDFVNFPGISSFT